MKKARLKLIRWDPRLETPARLWHEFKTKTGPHSRLKLVWMAINRIPQWTYPTGIKAYYDCLETEGQESIFSRPNLWRQVLHFTAGGLLGLAFPVWMIIIPVGIAESYNVYKRRKLVAKDIIDIAVWAAGAALGGLV